MNKFVNEFHPPATDIAICGSMAHKEQWLQVAEQFAAQGLTVVTPDISESTDWSQLSEEEATEQKGWFMRRHIANIAQAKAVLICNYEKNGVDNYIGSNCFLEMAVAFAYEKPLYVLNDIPEQNNREEMVALKPITLHGDVTKLIEEVRR